MQLLLISGDRVQLQICLFRSLTIYLYAWSALLLLPASPGACTAIDAIAQTTAPIELVSQTSTVLHNLRIVNAPGNCILLRGCSNIHIENCELAAARGEGVHLIGCTSVTITNCTFEDVRSGVYAVDSATIAVTANHFRNMMGPMPRGQFVQFDKVRGSGNRICYNTGVNIPGKSNPEDAINIYQSQGTVEDPIVISGNRIRGGGPSLSGGGIMLGDSGGRYLIARDNQLVDPGQYGIAVAGGSFIEIINNRIFARQQPFTNVGIYVWNQSPGECSHHVVNGNVVQWLNSEGKSNGAWNAGNCGTVTGWSNNMWDKPMAVPDTFPEVGDLTTL